MANPRAEADKLTRDTDADNILMYMELEATVSAAAPELRLG